MADWCSGRSSGADVLRRPKPSEVAFPSLIHLHGGTPLRVEEAATMRPRKVYPPHVPTPIKAQTAVLSPGDKAAAKSHSGRAGLVAPEHVRDSARNHTYLEPGYDRVQQGQSRGCLEWSVAICEKLLGPDINPTWRSLQMRFCRSISRGCSRPRISRVARTGLSDSRRVFSHAHGCAARTQSVARWIHTEVPNRLLAGDRILPRRRWPLDG